MVTEEKELVTENEPNGVDSVLAVLDFIEDVAIVLGEAIRDGHITVWDLRLLIGLYQPGKQAYSRLPKLVGELSDLSVPELVLIGSKVVSIAKSFTKALVVGQV